MKKKLPASLIALTMFSCLAADGSPEPEICEPAVHSDMIYFKHIDGKGYGYNEGYSTVGAFITPYSTFSHILPFLDLRGHVFNHTWKFAGNAGLGFKYLTDSLLVFGMGGYYDYRQTQRGHYHQAGLSLEFLCSRWEFRTNGYLPFAEKTHVRKTSKIASYNFEEFVGNSLFYSTTYNVHRNIEFAMKGVDGEVGFHLLEPSEFFTLYLGGGPYYFHSPHHIKRHAFGGQVRLSARVTTYLTLQLSDSWDNRFHNNIQGEVSVNIPFGGRIAKKKGNFNASCDSVLSMESRMVLPIHRNEIIVADKKKEHYYKTVDPVAMSIYGGPLDFIFVNASAPAGGNGTFEHPYNDLSPAQNASSPNDVLYVMSDFTLDYDVFLSQNQSLYGSGIPQIVPILVAPNEVGYVTIPALTTFTPALTSNNGNGTFVFINGDNTVISGLTFNGGPTENYAIMANYIAHDGDTRFPINNLTIINNTFNNTDEDALNFTAVTGNVFIINNTFNGNSMGGTGITFDEESIESSGGSYVANLLIQNNTFSDYTYAAINLLTNNSSDGASDVTALIQNNIFTGCGIQTESSSNSTLSVTAVGNTISGAYDGFAFQSYGSSTQNVRACSNNASNNLHFGLYLLPNDLSTVDYVICNNILNSNGSVGLGFDNSTSQTDVSMTALIQGNTINYNHNGGIIFLPDSSGVLSTKMTIVDNLLIENGDGIQSGYSLYYANRAADTITLFMSGNENTLYKYGLENSNTANGSFNVEKGGRNIGTTDLIGPNPSPFLIVDRFTAAPPTEEICCP